MAQRSEDRGEAATAAIDVVSPERDFDRFYRDEYRSVVGLAYTLSGSRSAAEELAQEAFLQAFRRWDRLAAYDKPEAWVRRVVADRSVSRWRRLGSEARALTRLGRQREPGVQPLPSESDEFWQAVRALPRRQAQVVALHYLEDRSVADVATVLELSEGAVKAHLHHARRSLAERFGDDADEAELDTGKEEDR